MPSNTISLRFAGRWFYDGNEEYKELLIVGPEVLQILSKVAASCAYHVGQKK
ncbi:Hypothetical protein PP7435_CHR2-1814 [Komagataella phaffii CBS 7435]|uniref:Uncharacterized protein n=1 Tax=Komagataella phaffii (strain ATCC 76273 / CBS 7435 / CECT 11047 / NRRL Y-11430 / Wegner 21-1) TaxID=981350 RepID=A0A1G4KPU5_KOMPC|nr:Hypothetical protein BQ9382_C2-2218 [Komagataella phaffii CBS 7435]SCV12013.1 Hypothetical protein PP7435_CHR2-1814 [Komagataella phaffii CBS 7435]